MMGSNTGFLLPGGDGVRGAAAAAAAAYDVAFDPAYVPKAGKQSAAVLLFSTLCVSPDVSACGSQTRVIRPVVERR